ncbi:MAG: PLP-dependent aminotransferase family protein, partial [Wohlfahrtiimonas sp.]
VATGNSELIRQIELRYLLSGIPLRPNELVITNGAMEALSLSLQAVTKPGDLVAIESPVFYAILQILERLQLKAVEIPVDPEIGIDLNDLEESLEQFEIKAVVLMTSFQNPLGATLSREQQQKLIKIIQRHQLPTIVDDVYSELYYSKSPPVSLKSLDESGLVIHCNSFSKCLAPGFRIGWVAGGIFTDQIERLKLMTTISPSMPSQLALSHYLHNRHYDRHLQRLRYVLALSQQKMLSAILKYFPKNIAVTEPDGGYFLWIELDSKINTLDLYKKALEHKISIAPGSIFSASQKFKHCIRLNYGMEWNQELENAMMTLAKIIKEFS